MNIPPTVARALADAGTLGLDRLDAQLLLGHLLQQGRTWLIAHDQDTLPAELAQRFAQLCARRAAGEPAAYLLGEREFHGLRLMVSPAVLVPRPDTEVLVDWALALLAGPLAHLPTPEVVDLGTGSGAIAMAVKHRHPAAQVTAIDASPEALSVAQDNAQRLGLGVQCLPSHWWQALAGRRFHLALSNPPYIAGNDPHLPALRHEPTMALTPGGDGLDAIRTLLQGAPEHLAPQAWLLIEHGWDQGAAVRTLLATQGFDDIHTERDIAGHERCTGGRWLGAPA
jgi:release factor glutamine methyltransferase